ncbi:MAG: mechanosensitive ion channel family protein [Hyphomonas sp.]
MAAGDVTYQKCITGADGLNYCRTVESTDLPPAAVGTTPSEAAISASEGLISQAHKWVDPILQDPSGWANETLLQPDVILPLIIQIGAIFAAMFVAMTATPFLKRSIHVTLRRILAPPRGKVLEIIKTFVLPVSMVGALYAGEQILTTMDQSASLVRLATSLAIAWVFIRGITTIVPDGLRKPLSMAVWAFAVLYAFGVHDDVINWLATVGPPFGGRIISPLFVLQAIATAALFLFGANWLAKKMKTRVQKLPKVEPSIRILMGNAITIGLFFGAALLTLAGLGIPFGGLAVLGGALGVGLGFGMQQIVSNFISGVILLTDRSIKPDDVIEVDDQIGIVKSLGLRYASVVTVDGTEHLIPNEMLITDKVVNWSFSDKQVRLRRVMRVEYESDIELAITTMEKGAASIDRVLNTPAPKAFIQSFGDEAIELEIGFWIDDPENGTGNVASDVLRAIWKLFNENGISIPLRREEVLIEPGSTIKVEMVPATVKDDA